MIKVRSNWFIAMLCPVLFFSLSIWTGRVQSSSTPLWECKHISVSQGQLREIQKIPYDLGEEGWELVAQAPIKVDDPSVILNPFKRWNPDTIGLGGASTISISVKASDDVPSGTSVTLSFGASLTGGSVSFTITPATLGDSFTFPIGPGESKTVTAMYQPNTVTGQPKVKAVCLMSVTPPQGYQGNVIARQPVDGQESDSELWIR